MKTQMATAFLVGALSLVPAAGFAAQAPAQKPAAAKHAAKATSATHATRGTVKSIDDATLVITRSGKSHAEMTFALNASTTREGTIAAGTPVSVRYREDGKTNVATAVQAEAKKPKTSHKGAARR